MNTYAQYLTGAVDEIRTFAATEEGRQWDAQWYDRVVDLVDMAIKQKTDEEAERILGLLMRMVVDSGPLNERFTLLHQAVDSMQRKQRQAP